jgi:hypothetical protein
MIRCGDGTTRDQPSEIQAAAEMSEMLSASSQNSDTERETGSMTSSPIALSRVEATLAWQPRDSREKRRGGLRNSRVISLSIKESNTDCLSGRPSVEPSQRWRRQSRASHADRSNRPVLVEIKRIVTRSERGSAHRPQGQTRCLKESY